MKRLRYWEVAVSALWSVMETGGTTMQSLELKIPPVVQVLVIAGLMYALAASVPGLGFTLPGSAYVALALAATGAGVGLLGVREFRSADTTVDPRKPDQSASLVVQGVYRISRNPMYLGLLLALLALAVFISNFASFVLLPAFVLYMNRFQIAPEERHMREKFGDAYRQYQTRVRRWI